MVKVNLTINLIIFQPIYKTITFSSLQDTISQYESKGLSNEKVKPPFTVNKSCSAKLIWMNNFRIRLRFTRSCLKQNYAAFAPNNLINLFIAYELDRWSQDVNAKSSPKDCLFGAVKLTKNVDPNKYSYCRYGIEFDYHSIFLIPKFDWSKHAIIFGVCMSSSVHANNKNKDILILGKGQRQGLDNTTLTAEAEYSIKFFKTRKTVFFKSSL